MVFPPTLLYSPPHIPTHPTPCFSYLPRKHRPFKKIKIKQSKQTQRKKKKTKIKAQDTHTTCIKIKSDVITDEQKTFLKSPQT